MRPFAGCQKSDFRHRAERAHAPRAAARGIRKNTILAGAFTPAGGTTQSYTFPVETKGYGWLDASLSYDINKHFTVTVDGQNLLRTQIQQYYQNVTRPGQYTIDDRQFMAGVRVKF